MDGQSATVSKHNHRFPLQCRDVGPHDGRMLSRSCRFELIAIGLLATVLPLSAMGQPTTRPTTAPTATTQPTAAEGAAAFAEGLEAMKAGDDEKAEPLLLLAAQAKPDSINAWFNLALVRQRQNKYESALEAFDRVAELNESDWQAHVGRAQALHGLDRPADAQAAVDRVRELREQTGFEADLFVRERFKHNEQDVLVIEHFELTGERGVKYVFYLLDDENKPLHRYSLGSYAMTNDVLRDMGQLEEGERLWHLDGYDAKENHETFGFVEQVLTYDQTKDAVLKILDEKVKAISGTTRNEDGSTQITLPMDQQTDKK